MNILCSEHPYDSQYCQNCNKKAHKTKSHAKLSICHSHEAALYGTVEFDKLFRGFTICYIFYDNNQRFLRIIMTGVLF